MHTPQQSDLVTGAVEPVVAQVDEDGGGRPGEGAVPGQVHLCTGRCRYLDMPIDISRYAYRYRYRYQSVVLVQPGVEGDHGAAGEEAHHRHQQPARDARHADTIVLTSAN